MNRNKEIKIFLKGQAKEIYFELRTKKRQTITNYFKITKKNKTNLKTKSSIWTTIIKKVNSKGITKIKYYKLI